MHNDNNKPETELLLTSRVRYSKLANYIPPTTNRAFFSQVGARKAPFSLETSTFLPILSSYQIQSPQTFNIHPISLKDFVSRFNYKEKLLFVLGEHLSSLNFKLRKVPKQWIWKKNCKGSNLFPVSLSPQYSFLKFLAFAKRHWEILNNNKLLFRNSDQSASDVVRTEKHKFKFFFSFFSELNINESSFFDG